MVLRIMQNQFAISTMNRKLFFLCVIALTIAQYVYVPCASDESKYEDITAEEGNPLYEVII